MRKTSSWGGILALRRHRETYRTEAERGRGIAAGREGRNTEKKGVHHLDVQDECKV